MSVDCAHTALVPTDRGPQVRTGGHVKEKTGKRPHVHTATTSTRWVLFVEYKGYLGVGAVAVSGTVFDKCGVVIYVQVTNVIDRLGGHCERIFGSALQRVALGDDLNYFGNRHGSVGVSGA